MKKISLLIIALFALLTTRCLAQQELSTGVHFGIKAGINVANVTLRAADFPLHQALLLVLRPVFSQPYLPVQVSPFSPNCSIQCLDLKSQVEVLPVQRTMIIW